MRAAGQAAEMRERLKMIENILGDNYDLDRLREIVEADRDGLCVVLPCKPGDILRHKGHDCEADHWNIVLTAFSKSEYTKSEVNIQKVEKISTCFRYRKPPKLH